ncbi:retrovirus-related pol polyprotein from transposon TNT 1-94 [Tanacetum coccineum]
MMLKMVPETPLQFGVAERLSRIFRAESTGLRAEAPKMLWVDSVSTTYLIHRIPYVLIGLCILEEEWRRKDTSLVNLKVFDCDSFVKVKDVCGEAMKSKFVTDSSSLTKPIQKSQVVLVEIPENLAENDIIVPEHGLSLEITQSPGGSSDTSEGSENSGSFEDIGRSDKEDSKDGAFSKEGGSEIPRNGEPMSYSETLSGKESVQWKKAINEEIVSLEKNQTCSLKQWVDYNEIFSPVVKMTTIRYTKSSIHLAKNLKNEEPCSDVHQVGDEIEVEVLRSFNWPLSELITEDGFLLERGYSQFNDVSSEYLCVPYVQRYRKVRAITLLKGWWFEVYKDYLRRRAVK